MATKKPPKAPSVTISNPRDVQSVYANSMEMSASLMDVRLLFNEAITKGNQTTFEQRANIVMSHEHFRTMLSVFLLNLKKIEEEHPKLQRQAIADLQAAHSAANK